MVHYNHRGRVANKTPYLKNVDSAAPAIGHFFHWPFFLIPLVSIQIRNFNSILTSENSFYFTTSDSMNSSKKDSDIHRLQVKSSFVIKEFKTTKLTFRSLLLIQK